LPFAPGERLLVIRPEGAGEGLARRLTVRGAEVHEAVAYRTEEGPTSSVRGLRLALAEARPAAVILTSGSAVRGLVRLAGSRLHELLDVPVICIGRPTAGAARAAGFRSVTIAAAPTPEALAAATAATLEVAR
jgi:uroporphyrinogen-III synthase